MKSPYELRVIADALLRYMEGPAINAMKYAETTLREIADEFEAKIAADLEGAKAQEQASTPSAPANPTSLGGEQPAAQPAIALDANGMVARPTQAATAAPAIAEPSAPATSPSVAAAPPPSSAVSAEPPPEAQLNIPPA